MSIYLLLLAVACQLTRPDRIHVPAQRTQNIPVHVRVLAMLEARVGEEVSSVPPHMLKEQSFDGVSFVGITASIHGLHGLHAQSGWFESDAFDWFWVEITDVRKIELRRDSRFRGG